ncbi:MAG: apolipoprotein N-acyltransferase [Sphingomonas sp.]|nr:apolipoprotein N-acyltransferase [Sphingomonas sp.]
MIAILSRRPGLAALLLGAAAATGFAPFNLWPVALTALALWLMLVCAAPSVRAALWRGWLFGWAHLTLANMWIAQAFTYQDAMPHWLGAPAVALLCMYLAIYPMMAAGLAWRWGRRHGVAGAPDLRFVLIAGAAWIVTEWLRGWALTGYPWPPLATIWVPVLGVAWSAAWVGTYALSGLTVMVAGALAMALTGKWRPAAVVATVVAALALSGVDIPVTAPTTDPAAPRLRVVQPNLDQEQRPRPDYAETNLRALLANSGTPGLAPRLILWPEGALRYLIEDGYPPQYYAAGDPLVTRRRIAAVLGPRDIVLTGGNAVMFKPDGTIAAVTNSIFAIDAKGVILSRYDKAHLVPWGEYLPWRPLLSMIGISRLVPGAFDFAPGPGPRTLPLPGFGSAGMLVCYEVIFSGEVVDRAHRPAFLFNPSNDSWYARFGPEQHLAMARLRAIEEGLPIIRATPTGISAIVDANGRITAQVDWGKTGAAEAPLPAAHPPTWFAVGGNWIALGLALLLAVLGVAIGRRAR